MPDSWPTFGDLRAAKRWIVFELTAGSPVTRTRKARPPLKLPAAGFTHPRIAFLEYQHEDGRAASKPADPSEAEATFLAGRKAVTTATPQTWLTYSESLNAARELDAQQGKRNIAPERRSRFWPALVHSRKGERAVDLTTCFLDLDIHSTDPRDTAWIDQFKLNATAKGLKGILSQSGAGQHFLFAAHPADATLWTHLWNYSRSSAGARTFVAGRLAGALVCKNQAKSHKHSHPDCYYSANAKVEMWSPDGDGRAQITKLEYYTDGNPVLDADPIPVLRFHDFATLMPEVEAQLVKRLTFSMQTATQTARQGTPPPGLPSGLLS